MRFAGFRAGLLACLLLLGMLLAGCSEAPTDAEVPAVPEAPDAGLEPEVEALSSTDQFQVGMDELGDRDALPGAALYAANCASCHAGSVQKAPHFSWLEMMPGQALYAAMTEGIMKTQSSALSDQQRVQVVEYLTRKRFEPRTGDDLADVRCRDDTPAFDLARIPARVGWGHDTSRFVPAEVGGLTLAQLPDLELKWAFAFPDAMRARSQAAAGFGAIYVGSQDGRVYALDQESGCVRWAFQASAEVRTAIVLTPTQTRPLAFFGDILARLYAVDALTGELVWSIKADDHPSATLTGTPALHGDTLYAPVSSLEVTPAADPAYECCTFRGKVMAVDTGSGEIRWQSYAVPEPPQPTVKTAAGTQNYGPSGAPIWASPAIDVKRNRLYVGTGENYSSPADGNSDAVLALDLDTGERIWTRQLTPGDAWNVACMMVDNPNCPEENGPDFDISASQLIIDLPDGGQRIVGGHKTGSVWAVDPDVPPGTESPELEYWTRLGRGSIQGGVHFGLAAEGTRIYVPINDMNDTRNGQYLDPEAARPGVHAVDALSGEVLWSTVQENVCGEGRPYCDPGISAAVTAIPGAVIAGHLDGHLRAYDGATGEAVWDFDMARQFQAVGGRTGRGGSVSGAGPLVADGLVVVNAGYGLYFHEPGNLLMVFGLPD